MGPSRKRVLEAIPTAWAHYVHIDTVATAVGLSYSTTRTHLRELRKAGLVIRIRSRGKDVYGIPATPEGEA